MDAGVDGILLAGGLSSRAGVFKMETPVGGKPLLLWGLAALAAACGRVIVVAGAGAEKVAALVAGWPAVDLVLNHRHAEGMLSSVQAGARRVRAPRFFVLPGDMPRIGPAVFAALLAQPGDIVVPACAGRRGHPVLLAGALVPGILAEPSCSSLGAFLRRRESTVVETGDPGVLDDIDVPADLARVDAWLRREENA
jgi:molybdenum cofactor cytidylyltransferase